MLALGDLHRFEAHGRAFVYLVPSGAIFALDAASGAILDRLADGPVTRERLLADVKDTAGVDLVRETLGELQQVRAVVPAVEPIAGRSAMGPIASVPAATTAETTSAARPIIPLVPVPLQTLVLNVTNKCNLACAYCYEYGEDRIVPDAPAAGARPGASAAAAPRMMDLATAKQSVELALRESGHSPVVNITFFGGETLLNFPVLRDTVRYARTRAGEQGKRVEFSLTTNATLLRPDIIDFLVEEQVGVTISIDGPRELQDRFRVFHNGAGSYDVVLPKIRELLRQHRRRPIGARVTLTAQVDDVLGIFRHLTEDIGFQEVGFAPVTSSLGRAWAMSEGGLDRMLQQFERLAFEWLDATLDGRHHAFSNIKETIEELHQGASKAYPCGAGFGLMGVATDGEVSLCHRFAGSPDHRLGSVAEGIDRGAQAAFLERHHLGRKIDCATCWARPLCSGGCYHEAYTRYGDTARPNLHFCDWIRGWIDVGLRVYGTLVARQPGLLSRFDADPTQVSHEASHAR